MCGIFGYVGSKQAAPIVRQGLKNLEYRGYDSWGVVAVDQQQLQLVKRVGEVPDTNELIAKLRGTVALAHTRWATNGGVTQVNAHPHLASDGKFALVHNGIVENVDQLKQQLQKRGSRFVSETDSEVIARLLETVVGSERLQAEDLVRVSKKLVGRNTFAVVTTEGTLFAMKEGSPLVVGRNSRTNEWFLSSDTVSMVGMADEFVPLDDGDIAELMNTGVVVHHRTGSTVRKKQLRWQSLKLENQTVALTEEHYMIQEIKETPQVLRTLAKQSAAEYRAVARAIRAAKQVFVIGSGSTGLAAAEIAECLRLYGGVAATAMVGAEAQSYVQFMGQGSVIIAPSQSGETADVLEVLAPAKQAGATIITFVNMPGSTMTQLADISCMTEAGPECCVMSTKVFSAQIVWGYLIAKAIARKLPEAKKQVIAAARALTDVLHDSAWMKTITSLATRFKQTEDLYLLGSGLLLPIAQEGMVKLIEGSYTHAHAMPAGDLKHYAITLMETGVPVVVLDPGGEAGSALTTAAREVRARGATTIGIGPIATEDFDHFVQTPEVAEMQPVLSVVVLQLLGYYLTKLRGLPVDKPRNIAKSVTVK